MLLLCYSKERSNTCNKNTDENMEKSKEPIRIRKRALRNGNISLYLDIYMNGKRSYEFLNLYLVPDKEKNKETLKLADAVRAQRVVEFQNGRFGFEDGYKLDTNFLDYYRMLCERRHQNPESLGNWGNWYSALKHLERYCRPDMTFRDVTPAFVQGFKDYLDKTARVRDKRRKATTPQRCRTSTSSEPVSTKPLRMVSYPGIPCEV